MKFTGERVVTGDMKKYIPTLQEHIARYNFALRVALNKKVLDAACGSGYGTALLSESASSILGVDVSDEAIQFCKEKYRDISFKKKDLDTEFPDGKFDLCVSFETIEHLKKPKVFLKNVADNCKEFLFSIPVNNPSEYHLHVWSKEEIETMINEFWSDVRWFHQNGPYIFDGTENATFLIGAAKK